MNNFEKEIYDWLYECPEFQMLYLVHADLTSENEQGQVVITPELMGHDNGFVKRYMRDTGIKRYTFNVAQYNMLVNVANSSQNTTILDLTKKIQEWVLNQIKIKNYPEIGYEIKKIEPTGVGIASVDENGSSKIQFQIIIDYYQN